VGAYAAAATSFNASRYVKPMVYLFVGVLGLLVSS